MMSLVGIKKNLYLINEWFLEASEIPEYIIAMDKKISPLQVHEIT